MYRNLKAEMVRRGIEVEDLAKLLGVSSRTMYSKINGKSDWRWSEIKAITEKFFPDADISQLFSTVDEEQDKSA